MNNNLDYGQHFLINNEVIKKMISYANILNNETILEIGGGNGILSEKIAPLCKNLDIIEIDENLKIYLDNIEKRFTNAKVYYNNALNISFKNYKKIITSLPYNILEPFLKKCVHDNVEFILMLIGDKYALSLKNFYKDEKNTYTQLLTHAFYNIEILDFVPKQDFNPPPRTGSYIVKLIRRSEKEYCFSTFILKELFSQEDKKIKNALMEALIRFNTFQNAVLTKKQAKAIIEQMNIDASILDAHMSNLSNEKITQLYKAIITYENQ